MKKLNIKQNIECSKCGSVKVYCKGLCQSCYNRQYKEQTGYNKLYRESHQQYYANYNKLQYEGSKGYYLYMFMDNMDNELYCGSTSNIQSRIDNHLCGNSNLKMGYEDWEKANLNEILYVEIPKGELSIAEDLARAELYYMERLLIEQYIPSLNGNKPYIDKNISIERQEELSYLVENVIVLDKYKLSDYKLHKLNLDSKKALSIPVDKA